MPLSHSLGSSPSAMTTPGFPLQSAPESAQTTNQEGTRIIVPMGFAAQLRAVQEAQQEQADRIAKLEQENADLKDFRDSVVAITDRVLALEQREAYRAARRREAVGQLGNMRTLHQEADNGFLLRTTDMQQDDLEGMLGAYGTMLTTAMNNHQHVLGQMRTNGQFPAYTTPVPQTQRILLPIQHRHAYPPEYSEYGFCHAHNMPYCCRVCGTPFNETRAVDMCENHRKRNCLSRERAMTTNPVGKDGIWAIWRWWAPDQSI